jgi:YCII-related domain-containing protein
VTKPSPVCRRRPPRCAPLWSLAIGAAAVLAATGALAAPAPATVVAAQPTVMFAVVYRPGPAWKPGVPMASQGLGPHVRYMTTLLQDGRIAAAGPLGPEGGLVLLYARDLADAQTVVAADPAVQAGLFTGRPERFVPRFVRPDALTDQGPRRP